MNNSPSLSPTSIVAECSGDTLTLHQEGSVWTSGDVRVELAPQGANAFSVRIASPTVPLLCVRLDWAEPQNPDSRFLGDAWERTYGDAGWRSLADSGDMPWYYLENSPGGHTTGWGVLTQPNAFASWRVRPEGRTLTLDLRAGGQPVRLGARTLEAVTVLRYEGAPGASAWQAGRDFCRALCPNPRFAKEPVYGYNDWYCAYGHNTAENFLADAAAIVACAEGCVHRPYVVVDDGWEPNSATPEGGYGPWDSSADSFGMSMPDLAAKIVELGAKPGLWYRPLHAWDDTPEGQRLLDDPRHIDPSVPETEARIREEVARFRDWGFRLVKIDYLTADMNGTVWGMSLGERVIPSDAIRWRRDDRTSAEVVKALYTAMREAAGDDVVIIGCNAINHLAAGLFEVQRIGDDTSGREWERTRKMGVNTLAFRSIQERAFFAPDADCVGLVEEGDVPWEKNRQWLDLVARSATPLFVSWKRRLLTPQVQDALREAFRLASDPRPTGEPLDWFDTPTPTRWHFCHFGGETKTYEW